MKAAPALAHGRRDEITRFKLTQTNENGIIAKAIANLLKAVGASGPILDVGAGAGDIANLAFPAMTATLIDVLPFDLPVSPAHIRLVEDYFDFDPGEGRFETVIMSHVLQYLDDDIDRLTRRFQAIAPRYLITVTNLPSDVLDQSLAWLASRGVETNPEVGLAAFPPKEFQPLLSTDLTGRFWADDHTELARLIGELILDASLDETVVSHFSAWLTTLLSQCGFSLDQRVQLYVRP